LKNEWATDSPSKQISPRSNKVLLGFSFLKGVSMVMFLCKNLKAEARRYRLGRYRLGKCQTTRTTRTTRTVR
jgi:hypothetical protein